MLDRIIQIKNGEIMQPYRFYKCDQCSVEIDESFPRWHVDGVVSNGITLCKKCHKEEHKGGGKIAKS